MAEKKLKSLTFTSLGNTYNLPELTSLLGNSEILAMSQAGVTDALKPLYEFSGTFEGVADIPIEHFDGKPVVGYIGAFDRSCTRACYSVFLGIPPSYGANRMMVTTYPLIENGLDINGNAKNGLTISQIKSLPDIIGFYSYRRFY